MGRTSATGSFCPRTQDQVGLIEGPNVFICEECVGLCTEILKAEADDPNVKQATTFTDHLS